MKTFDIRERTRRIGKGIFLVMLSVICVFTAVSCNTEAVSSEPCEVYLTATYDKALTAYNNKTIKYWEFMATPMFTQKDGEDIYGIVSYWRRLSALTTGTDGELKLETSIGKYTQGQWYFELRALNERGHVIAVGQTTAYISNLSKVNNVVSISVYTDSADGTHGESKDDTSRITGVTSKSSDTGTTSTKRYGTAKIGMLVNQGEYKLGDMRIVTTVLRMEKATNSAKEEVEVSPSWTIRDDTAVLPKWYVTEESDSESMTGVEVTGESTEKVPEGKSYFGTEIELDAGRYLISFSYQVRTGTGAWKSLGGQTVSTVIVGGEQTEIKGTLTPYTFIVAGIQIKVPGTIFGSIDGVGQKVSTTASSVTLNWYQTDEDIENSSESAVSFIWYIDGVKQSENSSTLVFSCPQNKSGEYLYGVYRVSLSPQGNFGSWGFTDIDIVFLPE